jgi:ribulose-5-phosphate 4-epimerase/fuculose-1-phosphate aldolase
MTPGALIADLVKAWRFLYRRGFIEGFGHLSARLPDSDQFLLTRHSLGSRAEPDDFLLMDTEGRKFEGRGDPPGEWPIHADIFKARADVGSIVQYHGLYSTAFTTSEHLLRPIHLMGTIFHEGLPIHVDPRLVSDRQRGQALARALGRHRAVLMRAHGAAIPGVNIPEAVTGAFLLEENARRAWIAASMGKPVWIDEETAADAGAELIRTRGPFRRVWALVESESAED